MATRMPEFTTEEHERIERQYPHASVAEKYRLLQAQRMIDQHKAGQETTPNKVKRATTRRAR